MTLTAPFFRDHQIRGLEVAMHDPHAVRVCQGRQRLHHELSGALRGERPHARHHVLERLAADELHHHQPLAVVLEQFVDGGDAGMAEPGNSDRFGPEALGDFRVVQFGIEDFDGHIAMEHLVHGAVDRAHTPLPMRSRTRYLPMF
jgi:hypothetical protein